jgi:hypothetical protein
MAADSIKQRMLTTEQASTYLNIPAETLTTWRCRGKGPAYMSVNKPDPRSGRRTGRNVVRYSLEKLDEWITAMTEVPA